MVLKGYQCNKPIEMLSQSSIQRIHLGSLYVLEKTGILFKDDEALKTLNDGGCQVDFGKQVARIPSSLAEECIRRTPSSFTLTARDSKYDLRVGDPNVYFSCFPGRHILDIETNRRRPARLADLADMVRLCDALPNIHHIINPVGTVEDKHPLVGMEWIYATELRNTEKTVQGPSFFGSATWVVRMAEAINVNVLGGICCASPLMYSKEQANGIVVYAKAGNPLQMLSGPQMGGTGPATLAGSLVLQNAEILAGLVLAQLTNPGVGVMYTAYTGPLDQRYGVFAGGAIEVGIAAVGAAQLAHHYRLPSCTFFPMTDAKIPDEQAAYEKHLQMLLCALAGVNYIAPAGGLENEGSFSAVQLLIDHEVCGMVGRVLEGIEVSEETLAIDLIDKVGPVPGTYLKETHTREWWRREQFFPKISERMPYERWLKEGGHDVVDRAKKEVKEILKNHQPTPLPRDLDMRVDEILRMAEKEKLDSKRALA